MIPILYEKDETAFASNGLGRLRDCISCVVTEERNGIYECDFEYPITADDFSDIQLGRIIGVTHDDSDDIQPFDIVSYEKPIDGIVKFHCTHISYRQSYLTVSGKNINSLADAFARLKNYATPTNPFTYETDKTSTGYLSSMTSKPMSVRSILGGVEGSILDAYGGEYEWDKFRVILHNSRGADRDFTIRYGVNMVDFNEELSTEGTYSACIPYWTDGTKVVKGSKVTWGDTVTGRGECVPLDVSDKFESKPTAAQVEAKALSLMKRQNNALPVQNIHVEFVRLQDLPEYAGFGNLLQCGLCDTIRVIFPFSTEAAYFKIVKTTWDVLADKYESMELGDLSMSLSEALGVSRSDDVYVRPDDYVLEQGTSGAWTYRKWASDMVEAWYNGSVECSATTAAGSVYRSTFTLAIPSGIFADTPSKTLLNFDQTASASFSVFGVASSAKNINGRCFRASASTSTYDMTIAAYVVS